MRLARRSRLLSAASDGPITGKNSGSRSTGGQQPQTGQGNHDLGPTRHPRVAAQPPDGRHTVGHEASQVAERPGRKAAGRKQQKCPGTHHQRDGQQQCPQPAIYARLLVTRGQCSTRAPCRPFHSSVRPNRRHGRRERGGQMSFSMSFHPAILGPSGAHWLDGPPDLSCQDSTREYAVDDPLLSCNQLRHGLADPR
jgi:hypothetical protein